MLASPKPDRIEKERSDDHRVGRDTPIDKARNLECEVYAAQKHDGNAQMAKRAVHLRGRVDETGRRAHPKREQKIVHRKEPQRARLAKKVGELKHLRGCELALLVDRGSAQQRPRARHPFGCLRGARKRGQLYHREH